MRPAIKMGLTTEVAQFPHPDVGQNKKNYYIKVYTQFVSALNSRLSLKCAVKEEIFFPYKR